MSEAGGSRRLTEEERGAIADDLALLAVLHDREPDARLLAGLSAEHFETWLGLRLTKSDGRAALDVFDGALGNLQETIDQKVLDRLAVEFARIYLTHHYRVSPNESVWLTEENITRQEPMFQIRAFYQRYGLEVENWRDRSDDHLVPQLLFVSHLIKDGSIEALSDAGRFLDRHLLIWVKDFAAGLAMRAEGQFHVGLALVTACYLDELRDLLAASTGESRRDAEFRDEAHRRLQKGGDETGAAPYIPGASPSW